MRNHPSKKIEQWPFNPASMPFFYGYIIVACSCFAIVASTPGQTIGVAAFTDHLIEAYGISRVMLSTAYMVGTIGCSLFVSHAGRLIDQHGARVVATAAAVGLGVGLVYLSGIDRIILPFVAGAHPFVRQASAFAAVTVGFMAIRFFGQGTLTLSSRTMLMQWFDRLRGRMNSVMGACLAVSFSLTPLIFERSINAIGWRMAWAATGFLLIAFAAPVIFILFRHAPEPCGLAPDGIGSQNRHPDKTRENAAQGWSPSQVKRNYTFWIFTSTLSLHSLVITAVSFHVAGIFTAAGLDRTIAFSFFFPSAIISFGVNMLAGILADTPFFIRRLHVFGIIHALMMALLCAAAVFLGKWSGAIWLMIVAYGTTGGLFGTMSAVSFARYYGRLHLGKINGLTMGILVFASAVGPVLFALSLSLTGSYFFALTTSAALGVLLAVAGLGAVAPASAASPLICEPIAPLV